MLRGVLRRLPASMSRYLGLLSFAQATKTKVKQGDEGFPYSQ
jgi:hypothetical protein